MIDAAHERGAEHAYLRLSGLDVRALAEDIESLDSWIENRLAPQAEELGALSIPSDEMPTHDWSGDSPMSQVRALISARLSSLRLWVFLAKELRAKGTSDDQLETEARFMATRLAGLLEGFVYGKASQTWEADRQKEEARKALHSEIKERVINCYKEQLAAGRKWPGKGLIAGLVAQQFADEARKKQGCTLGPDDEVRGAGRKAIEGLLTTWYPGKKWNPEVAN